MPEIGLLHRILGRLTGLLLAVSAATGAILALYAAASPTPSVPDMPVSALVERLSRHGQLTRLTQMPEGMLIAEFQAPRRRVAVDAATGHFAPLPPPGALARLATEFHRSLGLGSDAGHLIAGLAAAGILGLTLSGLARLRRRAGATWHGQLGLVAALPLVVSAATGLILTAAHLQPGRIDGLPPAAAIAGDGAPRAIGTIAALAVPLATLDDLALPRADDAEDVYHLATIDHFAEIDPATGDVLARVDRPVAHRLARFARRLHGGAGAPFLALGLGLGALAALGALLTGVVRDVSRWLALRPAVARGGAADIVVLYGTASGSTRGFAEALATRLRVAERTVAVAPMNDLVPEHAGARALVILTATDGAGIAPPSATNFLAALAILATVPPHAVLGFGDRTAGRNFCAYAETVAAALAARGGSALLPLGRVHRRDADVVAAWSDALAAMLARPLPAPLVAQAASPAPRVLSGPAMGARWTATVYAPAALDLDRLQADLAARAAVLEDSFSRFRPTSEVIRLDTAPLGTWLPISPDLARVLATGLAVGRRSGGAFDVGLAAMVAAHGFGAGWAATGGPPGQTVTPAHDLLDLDLDGLRLCKRAPLGLDLAGIAKGDAVDELAKLLQEAGIASFLVGLDGELRAGAAHPDGRPWRVGLEAPIAGRRDLLGHVTLIDRAVATSGDYRRRVGGHGHTLDPRTGAPRRDGPAAVTTLAPTCAAADAWATALLVTCRAGLAAAEAAGIEAIFADAPG